MAWLLNGYRFVPIAAPDALVATLEERATELALTGTVLVAEEGVNVALFGARSALLVWRARLLELLGEPLCDELWSELAANARPFRRLRVRRRAEIVTLGAPVAVRSSTSSLVPAEAWDELIATPGVRVVDVRNDYETELGSFRGALLPMTASFGEFPGWVEHALADDLDAPVAMFCTGGIRCAKAAAWLEARGFRDVRRLAGGVLGYLATPDIDHAAWQGQCFVFDDRSELPGEPVALTQPELAVNRRP